MKIIHFSQYVAPYKGGFINSLEALENYNADLEFVYCFPKECEKQEWISDFKLNRKVYFTRNDIQCSKKEVIDIICKENPDILHSHFDGYDIHLAKAKKYFLKKYHKKIKVIWHLRNKLSYLSDLKRKIYQFFIFQRHYGYWSKNINLIGVSEEVLQFVNQFAHFERNNIYFKNIQNGIPYQHLRNSLNVNQKPFRDFTFGAFGGRNTDKRIDILLKAAEILKANGCQIKIIITKGVDTIEILNNYFKMKLPDWLILVGQFQDVNDFFAQCDCFVSTSVHETFSNAIAEVSIFGLPIIQSDIKGTLWNISNPSTFVFKSLNAEDLANKMAEVMNTPKNELKIKCEITRENNINNIGIENWCEKITEFYMNCK